MNVPALKTASSLPAFAWWRDPKMQALVRKTAFKDCNHTEFDEAIAVARELNLSPLRKQIYAFVFNKGDEAKRNMVLVVSIDGARAIAARHKNYRPDDAPPRFNVDQSLKNELSNPEGLVSAEVSGFMFTNGEWFKVVGIAHWDEFAPLTKAGGDDDYEWVETGETWPDTGKPKKKKKLREGASITLRLDPKKDGWRKMPRLMLAKCAEMVMLRKGWPEDLSRIYAEEETHKGAIIDAEWTDLTPSEMADKGEADARQALIGGPALFATFDEIGTLERIPIGQFADRMLAATSKTPAAKVMVLIERNREALKEFWAHNKTDALALKRELEIRSGIVSPSGETQRRAPADKSPAQNNAEPLATLLGEIGTLKNNTEAFDWATVNQGRIAALSENDRKTFDVKFLKRQGEFSQAFKKTLDQEATG